MRGGRHGIWIIWGWANGCGLLLGVLLHLLFAHSTHSPAEPGRLLIEKLAFSTAAFVLCLLQQMLVRVFVRNTWRDVLFQTGLTISAFWIGFYAMRIPGTHLLMICLSGIGAGWWWRNRCGEWRRWMWLSTVGFLLAAASELLAAQSPSEIAWLVNHVTAFNYFGLFAGVASTVMTAGQLANSLCRKPVPHQVLGVAATPHSLQLLLQ